MKFLLQMFGECDDPESFRGVVSPVNHVELIFMAEMIARVTGLPGEVSIDAGSQRVRQKKRSTAAHNRKALNRRRAGKIRANVVAECITQTQQKLVLGNRRQRRGDATDVASVMIAESSRPLKTKPPRQHGIVA